MKQGFLLIYKKRFRKGGSVMGNIVIVALLVLIVILALRKIIKDRKNGVLCSCGGNCAGCAGGCRTAKTEKTKKNTNEKSRCCK